MKTIVKFKVYGRIEVEVEGNTKEEILDNAYDAFAEADLTKMDFIDASPVAYYDKDGNIHDL